MNKLLAGLILLIPLYSLGSISNAEVRNEIQAVINASTFPQSVDAVTDLVEMNTSTRGIVYIYQVNFDQDQLGPISTVMKNLEQQNLDTLCTNPVMDWYKTNDVDMIYWYFDKSENFVSSFTINSNRC